MKRTLLLLCLLAGFFLLSYRGILLAPGHVYQNWDNGIPPFSTQLERYGSISQYAWNPLFEMGAPSAMGSMNRWFDALVRIAPASLGGAVLAKWYALAYVLVGGAGMALLCRTLGLSFFASFIACLLFAFNPRIYSLSVSGHLFEVGFALSLIPWAVLCLVRAGRGATRRAEAAWTLAAGLFGGLICSASPYGIVFFGALLFLYAGAEAAAKKSLRPLWRFVSAGAVVVVLHLFWLVPTVVQFMSGGAQVKYNQRTEDLGENYRHMYEHFSVAPSNAMIGHTDNYGMGTEYAYPVSTRETPVWKTSAYLILGLAIIGLYFRSKNKGLKLFALLCLAAGFFLMAGNTLLAGRYFYEAILSRVQMVFFLMARPARWLPIFFTGLALMAGMGVQAMLDRRFKGGGKWADRLIMLAAVLILAVYLRPYWDGSISEPKTTTTQTMALTPQLTDPAEEALARRLTDDPEDYRVTVWPTIAGPTGDVPEPPKSSLTRNFGMMGKDAAVGPSFIGQPYTSFLLSLMHRPWPYADRFGRLLGLAAVKRALYDPDEMYLSYSDFGWMPSTKRGPETLSDPLGVLKPFVEAQEDLAPDADWRFGGFEILDNEDYLPRVRRVPAALFSSGGLPLLQTLAELPENLFRRAALFPAAEIGAQDLSRLGPVLSGAVGAGDGSPERLLPFLPEKSFVPALAGGATMPDGFVDLAGRAIRHPRLDGSALSAGAVISDAPGQLRLTLPKDGEVRVALRYARLPGGGGLVVTRAGKDIFVDADEALYDQGPRWADLGVLQGPGELLLSADGAGVMLGGALIVAPEAFDQARLAYLERFGRGETLEAAEAESAAGPGAQFSAKVYAPEREFPLLAVRGGVTVNTLGARLERTGVFGDGMVAVEGSQPGEALFVLSFGRMMERFHLTTYPRLFGDPETEAFIEASYSLDGRFYAPLYRIAGEKDGRWEDVYARRMDNLIAGASDRVYLRFRMRQAQLSSQANRPNSPMRLTAEPAGAPPGVASFGQGVFLPADFSLTAPRAGRYRLRARILGRQGDAVALVDGGRRTLAADGAQWLDFGEAETDASGRLRPAFVGADGTVCDILALSAPASAPASADKGTQEHGENSVTYARLNPGRYDVALDGTRGGVLLFSEAYNPLWLFSADDGAAQAPLRAYGFMNAWLLPEEGAAEGKISYRLQEIQESWLPVSEAGWIVFSLAALGLALSTRFGRTGASGGGREGNA